MAIPMILQQLGRSASNPRIAQIKQAAQMLRGISNPQAMLEQMLAKNPQAALIVRSASNPQEAFYALAKQQGIDPNDILSMLR